MENIIEFDFQTQLDNFCLLMGEFHIVTIFIVNFISSILLYIFILSFRSFPHLD